MSLFGILGMLACNSYQSTSSSLQVQRVSSPTRTSIAASSTPVHNLKRAPLSATPESSSAYPEQQQFLAASSSSASPDYSLPGSFLTAACALVFTSAFALGRLASAPKARTVAFMPMTGVEETASDNADGLSEIFTFDNLRSAPGSRKPKNRKGRGHSAGQGATCGFGTRGQKSRAGSGTRPGFEGGQNPLWRRTPKLRGRALGPGHKRTLYNMVSLLRLCEEAEGATVQFDDLSGGKPVLYKIGGVNPGQEAKLPGSLTVKAHAFTGSARAAIEAAGGKCVVIDKYSRELDDEGKVVSGDEEVAMFSCTSEVLYYNESEVEEDMFISDDEGTEPVAMFAGTAERTVKVGMYREPTMRSSIIRPSKEAIITQVREQLNGSFLVFGFSMDAYTMSQITKLRAEMPEGVKIQVVKNTLFRLASRGTGFEALDPLTVGSKAWVFAPEDKFQDTIKAFEKFLKKEKKQKTNPVLGGATSEGLLGEEQVMALQDIPTKKESIAKLAGLLKAMPTRLARGLQAVPRKLAIAIRLAAEKQNEGQ